MKFKKALACLSASVMLFSTPVLSSTSNEFNGLSRSQTVMSDTSDSSRYHSVLDRYTMEELSEMTGILAENLQELLELVGEEHFRDYITSLLVPPLSDSEMNLRWYQTYYGRNVDVAEIEARMLDTSDPFEHWILDYTIADRYTMEELSEMSGIPVEHFYQLLEDVGEQLFRRSVAVLFASMFTPPESESHLRWFNPPNPNANRVTAQAIQSRTRPGDIHLTPQGRTLGQQHGHAALAFNHTTNIEILGLDQRSQLISNHGWGNYYSYALYFIPQLSSGQIDTALRYSIANLMGLNYNPFGVASVAANTVNCASLVWLSYARPEVLQLDAVIGAPFFPRQLSSARQTTRIFSHNY